MVCSDIGIAITSLLDFLKSSFSNGLFPVTSILNVKTNLLFTDKAYSFLKEFT